ncbi:MAG: 50S ribosomal protein L11 methyltransferase [Omnitrophica bacterium]|nr:50S ribosomal protein L11 methyltransferase [Candidatus Omnitrophota bacterium]
MSNIAWAAGTPLGPTSTGPNRTGGSGSFKLPHHLGEVKQESPPAGEPANRQTIIHIKDAHCDYACQHAIKGIVEYINREYGVDLALLEGGAGNYDLSVFTEIEDIALREKVADYFVKEGRINGAELFAIMNPKKITLKGLEDPEAYTANLNAYRESLKVKPEVEEILNDITQSLDEQKKRIYSEELTKLDWKKEDFANERLKLSGYVKYLLSLKGADKPGISYENLTKLTHVLELEKAIDYRRANSERKRLIDKLTKRLSKGEIETLVEKSALFKENKIKPVYFYTYLLDKMKVAGINPHEKYPNVSRYKEYLDKYDSIDKYLLFREIEALEDELFNTLATNDKQKKLYKESKHLAILKDLFNLTITRDKYDHYRTLSELGFDTTFKALAPYLKLAERSYELAFERDFAFMRNIEQHLTPVIPAKAGIHTEQTLDSRFRGNDNRLTGLPADRQTIIIVTGGFHGDNLKKLITDKGYSYISIMPKFEGNREESPYFRLLNGEMLKEEKVIREAIASLGGLRSTSAVDERGLHRNLGGGKHFQRTSNNLAIRSMFSKLVDREPFPHEVNTFMVLLREAMEIGEPLPLNIIDKEGRLKTVLFTHENDKYGWREISDDAGEKKAEHTFVLTDVAFKDTVKQSKKRLAITSSKPKGWRREERTQLLQEGNSHQGDTLPTIPGMQFMPSGRRGGETLIGRMFGPFFQNVFGMWATEPGSGAGDTDEDAESSPIFHTPKFDEIFEGIDLWQDEKVIEVAEDGAVPASSAHDSGDMEKEGDAEKVEPEDEKPDAEKKKKGKPKKPPEGSAGIGISQTGILPHRGDREGGTMNDQIVETLARCVKDRGLFAKLVKITEGGLDKYDVKVFKAWFGKERKPGDDVPPVAQIDIEKLASYSIQVGQGGWERKLWVVELPVEKLGEIDGEPFTAHLGFTWKNRKKEGVIWVAADRDEIEVELDVMHEEIEYILAHGEAIKRGWPMEKMVGWRDGEYFDKDFGFDEALYFFNENHRSAWQEVVNICQEDVNRYMAAIPIPRAEKQHSIALEKIRRMLKKAEEYYKAANQAEDVDVPHEFGIGIKAGKEKKTGAGRDVKDKVTLLYSGPGPTVTRHDINLSSPTTLGDLLPAICEIVPGLTLDDITSGHVTVMVDGVDYTAISVIYPGDEIAILLAESEPSPFFPLSELARRIWPKDFQLVEEDEINGVICKTIFSRNYVIVGDFLFIDKEEWKLHEGKLQAYRNNIIICKLVLLDDAYAYFKFGELTNMSLLLLQAGSHGLRNQVVLDAGCGNDAILATLASRLGAKNVIAVDNSEFSITEAKEYLVLNKVDNVRCVQGLLGYETVPGIGEASVVIANMASPNHFIMPDETKSSYFGIHDYLLRNYDFSWYFMCGLLNTTKAENADSLEELTYVLEQGEWEVDISVTKNTIDARLLRRTNASNGSRAELTSVPVTSGGTVFTPPKLSAVSPEVPERTGAQTGGSARKQPGDVSQYSRTRDLPSIRLHARPSSAMAKLARHIEEKLRVSLHAENKKLHVGAQCDDVLALLALDVEDGDIVTVTASGAFSNSETADAILGQVLGVIAKLLNDLGITDVRLGSRGYFAEVDNMLPVAERIESSEPASAADLPDGKKGEAASDAKKKGKGGKIRDRDDGTHKYPAPPRIMREVAMEANPFAGVDKPIGNPLRGMGGIERHRMTDGPEHVEPESEEREPAPSTLGEGFTEEERELINKLWQDLSHTNEEHCRQLTRVIQEKFTKKHPNDFQAIEIGNHYELSEFMLKTLGMTKEYGDCRTAIRHALDNLYEHGRYYGALLLRSQLIDNKRIFSFIILDRGNGFVTPDGSHAPIHRAIQRGISFSPRATNRDKGFGLYQINDISDQLQIITVNRDRIQGKSKAYYWKTGFLTEEVLEAVPVSNGTQIIFRRELSEFTTSGDTSELSSVSPESDIILPSAQVLLDADAGAVESARRLQDREGRVPDLAKIPEGQPFEAEAVDSRPVNAGLLHSVYAMHDMAVRQVVNPGNMPLRAVYGAAGANVSNFLLSTNATEGYFVSNYHGISIEDLKILEDERYFSEYYKDYVVLYTQYKFRHGYAAGYDLDTKEKIIGALAAELNGLGVSKVKIETNGTCPMIRFKWSYKGANQQDYAITFIDADITKPENYMDTVRELSEFGKIDLYYQRAAQEVPITYTEPSCFLYEMHELLNEGGFFVTDDCAATLDYTLSEITYTDYGSHFPLQNEVVDVAIPDGAAFEKFILYVNPSGRVAPESDRARYGWRVRIRQKAKPAAGTTPTSPAADVTGSRSSTSPQPTSPQSPGSSAEEIDRPKGEKPKEEPAVGKPTMDLDEFEKSIVKLYDNLKGAACRENTKYWEYANYTIAVAVERDRGKTDEEFENRRNRLRIAARRIVRNVKREAGVTDSDKGHINFILYSSEKTEDTVYIGDLRRELAEIKRKNPKEVIVACMLDDYNISDSLKGIAHMIGLNSNHTPEWWEMLVGLQAAHLNDLNNVTEQDWNVELIKTATDNLIESFSIIIGTDFKKAHPEFESKLRSLDPTEIKSVFNGLLILDLPDIESEDMEATMREYRKREHRTGMAL